MGVVRSSSAGKGSAEHFQREARAVLQRELFRNLLTLAQHFLEDEEKGALYCPQHLLERSSRRTELDASAA